MRKFLLGAAAAGLAAGILNGMFGGGGGMILVPALLLFTDVDEDALFPLSVSVMLPVSLVSLALSARQGPLPWSDAFPYLVGSSLGGLLVGWLGKKLPTVWLHRILGVAVLWGGVRYLC